MESYTVSELANSLECSLPVAKKKALSNHSGTTFKVINGKKLNAYKLSNDKLIELKEEIFRNKLTFVKNNDTESAYEVVSGINEVVSNRYVPAEQSPIVEIMREYKNDLKELYKEHNEQLLNTQLQVRLLEDSERRKENEYLRQIAELKTENEKLKQELKKPFWKKSLFF